MPREVRLFGLGPQDQLARLRAFEDELIEPLPLLLCPPPPEVARMHVGRRPRGADSVHPHAVLCELDRVISGQRRDPSLAHTIGSEARSRKKAERRGAVQNHSSASLYHAWYHRVAHEKHAPQIYSDGAVKLIFAEVFELPKRLLRTSVVEENVNPPVCLQHFTDGSLDFGRLRHIASYEGAIATSISQHLYGVQAMRSSSSDHGDLRPLFREQNRGRSSDACSRACHNRHFVIESSSSHSEFSL